MTKATRNHKFNVEYDPDLVLEKDILPIFKRYDGDKIHIIIGVVICINVVMHVMN